jgi:hypothetical protein
MTTAHHLSDLALKGENSGDGPNRTFIIVFDYTAQPSPEQTFFPDTIDLPRQQPHLVWRVKWPQIGIHGPIRTNSFEHEQQQ